ncbi:IS110 family transposase [Muricoccus aerilatus]|uniref:IS110 family transposase n=1 Tax=Muricoccus aerilatus TaxID=452982 RepID=UPI0005C23BCF|nr:IS110 family transposase [Roseomonas aerilata]
MEYFAAVDVSLKLSSVCVVDGTGRILHEAKVASEPEALVAYLKGSGLAFTRVGLEAGPLSQWMHAGLTGAGLETVLLETRHVKAVLRSVAVKTDRNDARGMAQMIRMGWFRPVHAKTIPAQEVRALLAARKQLQARLNDLGLCLRGILRGFGLKLGEVGKARFEARVRELVAGQRTLESLAEPMLRARAALRAEYAALHREVLRIVRVDDECRRMMTVPGVGAIVAMTFKAAVDDPSRFKHSRDVGAHFGLTPRRYQSGEVDRSGSISKTGDGDVRTALFEAAHVMLLRVQRFSALRAWALRVAKARGLKRAKVALARKLAVVLHRLWVDGTEFRWSREAAATA